MQYILMTRKSMPVGKAAVIKWMEKQTIYNATKQNETWKFQKHSLENWIGGGEDILEMYDQTWAVFLV